MINTPPDSHTGWVRNKLLSTTVTDAWAGAQEAFVELWRSTGQEKDNDSTMSDAKGTKNTEEEPAAGTNESENDKDATMNDVEEYKDTKETYG